MHDAIIVGAGPAGLRSAALLERKGIDLIVLDKKPVIGRPVQCSGLISTNIDSLVRLPERCIEHTVMGAIVHGPGKRELRLKKKSIAAYVIDREALDSFLASRVKSDILMETEVKGISFRGSVTLTTSRGIFRSRAVVGCDGPNSVVRQHFGAAPREMLQGIIVIEKRPDRSRHVELWLDRDVCDGFLWKIPRGKSVEYGMLGSRANFGRLTDFFGLDAVHEKRAGLIPIGPCRTYFDRTLLVGDAAAQTKPWSGGGVVYSLLCAGHAAETLSSALEKDDLSENALSEYERAWKRDIEKPITLGMMGRELYKEMSNKQLAEFMDRLSRTDLSSLDMDFPAIGI